MGQTIGVLDCIYENMLEKYGPWQRRVLMVGLDNAGKTTVLFTLKSRNGEKPAPPAPNTMGYNVEMVRHQGIMFSLWDLGGHSTNRVAWLQLLPDTQGLIFVVDSNDKKRITEARDELHKLLKNDELSGVRLLVLANKQDLDDKFTTDEITEKLQLRTLPFDVWWHIQECCATSGDGLSQGLDWLASALANPQVTDLIQPLYDYRLHQQTDTLEDYQRALSSDDVSSAQKSAKGSSEASFSSFD
ncbi:protein MpARFD4 [Marchantia polymorpha subsp. ruderalis]|uniref:Uncharacterized protein n=2 Tax=Marchantia polymorpha TaxID=3197 RepID=A0AAF6AYS8_MARPO|nr:hypothetical protein MARPO_0105s0044 [Marchantia polymorpha]BBN04912.1 hypothetical protein Mp_3g08730 [Marchantia polymorpha subsp. ruderalis]|eukprot:PTQ31932.1 hypothetical protein MARPO_0105s0044 [Marchantia polymorpha]